jgi:hypothetical protein
MDPTPVIPCPRPCLATAPPPRNRTHGGEPSRDFTGGRAPVDLPPPSLSRAVKPPSLADVWACATAPSPVVSLAIGPAGPPAAPARALAPEWAKIPPGPSSRKTLFFFFFSFLFPFSYIELYADILCTKNSLNKL